MYFRIIIMVLSFILLIRCKDTNEEQKDRIYQKSNSIIPDGSYVSNRYEDRNEGYDWVGVEVVSLDDTLIKISIRSRADLKRPTCTLHCIARKLNDTVYQSVETTIPVRFKFTKQDLSIYSSSPQELAYFCSGGASIEGKYRKILETLDTSQVDTRLYSKYLHSDGINFEITMQQDDSLKILSVKPAGLSKDNSTYTQQIDKDIVSVRALDLNDDDSPELLIVLKDFNSQKSTILAFTTNQKKSMSTINFEATDFYLYKGYYSGYDTYEIEKGKLVRKFPVFENGEPSNYQQIITYKLEPGEAMPQFKIYSERSVKINQ
ncbi:hypothetical protein [Zunongwangia sp. HRR-M8]|uniref:hypothetical protein n=1 Tax=Zunongwangia sp. HRR-M8 TaxID=3015170 RepID=UPI0022DD4DC6|nr:hypothetical protein [Zunongwangia sp. HRR-M8]WBL23533.1 hypothetical protein PBT89_06125 [Zunongwangia sp. HRR-M8]